MLTAPVLIGTALAPATVALGVLIAILLLRRALPERGGSAAG